MTTYAQLKSDAMQWTLRTDVEEEYDHLIRNVQARIDRAVRVLAMGSLAQVNFQDNAAVLPGDYLGLIAIHIASQNAIPITYVPPDRFFKSDADFAVAGTSDPEIYTIFGSSLYVAPPPNHPLTIYYYARFASLNSDESTNWLLTNAYDIYLQAMIAEIYAFTRNEEEEAAARLRFDTAVSDLHDADRMATMSGSALQSTGAPYDIV